MKRIERILTRRLKNKEFKYETDYGGMVEGKVDAIYVNTYIDLDRTHHSYNVLVQSTNKNLYAFERCYFKQ